MTNSTNRRSFIGSLFAALAAPFALLASVSRAVVSGPSEGSQAGSLLRIGATEPETTDGTPAVSFDIRDMGDRRLMLFVVDRTRLVRPGFVRIKHREVSRHLSPAEAHDLVGRIEVFWNDWRSSQHRRKTEGYPQSHFVHEYTAGDKIIVELNMEFIQLSKV